VIAKAADHEKTPEEIAAAADLSAFDEIIVDVADVLGEAAGDVATEVLARIGVDSGEELVNVINDRAVAMARNVAAEMVGMRWNADDELVPAKREAWRIDETTRTMIRDIISNGLDDNIGNAAIADAIESATAFSAERAALIAHTEIAIVNSKASLLSYKGARDDLELDIKKAWLLGENPCEICQGNADQGPIDLDDEFESGDTETPAHPNAVLSGSTFVPYGGLVRMIAAEYDGAAVALHAGPYQTTIGPNHPMLTSQGMVRAKDLKLGDKLVYDTRTINSSTARSASDLHKVERVEDAFGALCSAFGNSTITAAADDFHGDTVVQKNEVNVVFPERKLLEELDSCGLEQFRDSGFVGTDVQLQSETAVGALAHHFERILLPTSGVVGGDHIGHFVLLKITSVEPVSFKGRAFDCTTPSSLYCSDGFVVSNCECAISPVVGSGSTNEESPNSEE
jgi:hypothetical protein